MYTTQNKIIISKLLIPSLQLSTSNHHKYDAPHHVQIATNSSATLSSQVTYTGGQHTITTPQAYHKVSQTHMSVKLTGMMTSALPGVFMNHENVSMRTVELTRLRVALI